MAALQQTKPVSDGYIVSLDDLDWLLYALPGTIILPNALTRVVGFYVTVVNFRGGTVAFSTPGSRLASPSGNTSLPLVDQHVTLTVTPDNIWLGIGMP